MDSAKAGQLDPQRLAEWHALYATRLLAFATGLLRNHSLAEEVVQNTFAQALVRGGDVQPDSVKSWLFQVAFNQAMELRRRHKTDQVSLRKQSIRDFETSTPEAALLQQETLERIQQALRRLPAEQQAVVNARIYDQLTFQNIADQLQLPLGTVLTRMRLALARLQVLLQDHQ